VSTREQLSAEMVRRLASERSVLRTQFFEPAGTSTRHFVCDDFLAEDVAQEIASSFPKDFAGFRRRNDFRERKRTSVLLDDQEPILRETTFAFQSTQVVAEIARITDIPALEPDPKLYAGGLSMMEQGDYLQPHIDNSHDSERKRYRRVNLLYYASRAWMNDCGGNFELWDEKVVKPKVIVAKFNRLVVMETTPTSYHSVNTVQIESSPRCCVSNYFFSSVSPTGDEYYHVTEFKGRPGPLRLLFQVDAILRNFGDQTLGLTRGRSRLYKPKSD
jgi:Rps23 Pro-64 3,4-dihydroxylase Tpa1-like proline 4-hydroxylase